MQTRLFLAVGIWLFSALAGPLPPVSAVVLKVQTAKGDTAVYAPPGDTVAVVVTVDSEGEMLTGVEVFLRFDPRLFQALDGLQPAESGGLLKEVLADTLLSPSDSLALIHYAEADLAGRAVSGRLFTLRLRVIGRISGVSPIAVYRDPPSRRVSVYTVPTVAGRTFELDGVRSLLFRDLPPVLSLPDVLEVEEDGALSLHLDPLATDAESASELLDWLVTGPDSLVAVALREEGDSSRAVLTPVDDFNGSVPILFAVADPSGGEARGEAVLRVLPVNDPPRILSALLPDSLLLSTRTHTVSLEGAAQDVDDPLESLVWEAEAEGSVQVAFETEATVKIFARVDWSGTEFVRLRLTDPSGASDTDSIRVYRDLPLEDLPGDFDGDGRIDFSDFLAFVQAFGQEDAPADFDLDGNSQVDFSDFLIFTGNFGRTSP